ncbi:hypothetical protein [Paraburkholderia sp. MM6662-R1]|uniref:hypothetical protein n=1 Tax=Paraburkholderia sp. MM6662-R1 TaxID=2991066 RepID=UPI003D257052
MVRIWVTCLIIERGTGEAVPTVHRFGERLARKPLIRINAQGADAPAHRGLGLQGSPLETLRALELRL